MRHTQTRTDSARPAASTTVLMTELMKFTLVLCVLALRHGRSLAAYLRATLTWPETLPFAVPALCFTLQTNVLWLGISLLDPPTYMITGQLKISLTALFAACLLGQSFRRFQLLALGMLQIGVVLVQIGQMPQVALDDDALLPDASLDSTLVQYFVGIVAVVGACASSGFASVYFERLLKSNQKTSVIAVESLDSIEAKRRHDASDAMLDDGAAGKPSAVSSIVDLNDIWMRNLQLSLFALPLSCLAMLLGSGRHVLENGVTYGYDKYVWFAVLNSSIGGVLVAAVMKYCDNVLKGFATTVSIVLASFVSAMWLDFEVSANFLCGTALVVVAVILYGWPSHDNKH
jgi:UDP-sugar transporter A1/2/3